MIGNRSLKGVRAWVFQDTFYLGSRAIISLHIRLLYARSKEHSQRARQGNVLRMIDYTDTWETLYIWMFPIYVQNTKRILRWIRYHEFAYLG